jgi:mannosyl-3-phosphoglycerate phosphatase
MDMMFIGLPLLVFTDLDGTLIEHENYSFAPAMEALAALTKMGAGVIMASSKTGPEIAALQYQLDLTQWPAIVENGAGLLEAKEQTSYKEYAKVRAALDLLPPALRANYIGFGDMTAQEISAVTGLPLEAAILAGKRAFSEPGLWSGSAEGLKVFLEALAKSGVHAREGGRFLTLSLGATKADRMADIIEQYKPRYTMALGDAPNDVEMLEAADFGVIVNNPHRPALPPLAGEATGRITRTDQPGPHGWNTAILDLIARLELE